MRYWLKLLEYIQEQEEPINNYADIEYWQYIMHDHNTYYEIYVRST